MEKIANLDEPLKGSQRTSKKLVKFSSRNLSGTLSLYNCARLRPLVVRNVFGPSGVSLVHEACARAKLHVSNAFLRDAHQRVNQISRHPITRMKKSQMASRRDELLHRIALGSHVMESRAMLFGHAGRDEFSTFSLSENDSTVLWERVKQSVEDGKAVFPI